MKRKNHRWLKALVLTAVFSLLIGTASPALAEGQTVDATSQSQQGNDKKNTYDVNRPDPKSKTRAEIVMDASTGQVLYGKNISHTYPIASVTKIITLGVIEQDIKAGKLKWNTKIKINHQVAKLSRNWRFSNVTLEEGRSYTVRNLVNSMMVVSADASSAALALKDAGSTAAFNKKMRKFVAKAGVHDENIVNMIGLNNGDLKGLRDKSQSKKAENLFSAHDVALISRYLVNKYPETLGITSQKEVQFQISKGNSFKMTNINNSLPGGMTAPKNGTIDGLKTGNTDTAGNCFAGTGTYNGHRLIMVVLHATGQYNEQFRHANQDVNTVLATMQPVTYAKHKDLPANVRQVTVAHGKKTSVDLAPTKAVTAWIKKGTKSTKAKASLTLKAKYRTIGEHKLRAPLKKGTVVGYVTVKGAGHSAGYVKIPVKTTSSVKKGSFF